MHRVALDTASLLELRTCSDQYDMMVTHRAQVAAAEAAKAEALKKGQPGGLPPNRTPGAKGGMKGPR